MRIEDLKIFVDVVQNHSMNVAAEKNFTSPQNLSKIIKRMEDELGVVLFERSKKGSSLTVEGESFYTHILEVLQSYNDAVFSFGQSGGDEQRKFQSVERSKIRILCSSGALSYAVMDAYNKIRNEGYNLVLEEDEISFSDVQRVVDHVKNKQFDIIACLFQQDDIDYVPNILPDFLLMHVIYDELVLVVSKNNPLAKRRRIATVELSELNMINFIDFSLPNKMIDSNLQYQFLSNSHDKVLEQVKNSTSCCTLLFKSFCEFNPIEFGKNGDFRMIFLDKKIYGNYLLFVRKECLREEIVMHFMKILEENFFHLSASC